MGMKSFLIDCLALAEAGGGRGGRVPISGPRFNFQNFSENGGPWYRNAAPRGQGKWSNGTLKRERDAAMAGRRNNALCPPRTTSQEIENIEN